MKIHFIFILLLFSITACELIRVNEPVSIGEVEGVRPIYTTVETLTAIETLPPQPIQNLGKIYYKDSLIYVNERNQGFHIIDNTNPANPIPIQFIRVLGSEDIAIKGNALYVDNLTDLVVLDITDRTNIKEVKRIPNLYPEVQQTHPVGYSGYFECVDPSKGIIIGWESTTLVDPTCWR